VLAIEQRGIQPSDGTVLVTGTTGGVGSIATALLAARGFRVAASSGRKEMEPMLRGLGAAEIVGRLERSVASEGPLAPERWAAAVDTVGGATLTRVLAELRYGGVVAATGFITGLELTSPLAPFLLRAVELVGINTSQCPIARRRAAWDLLAASLPVALLDDSVTTIALGDVPEVAARMLEGGTSGRIVVDVRGESS
jgi:acrylyl-CoA reductase (NADPH)